MAEAAKKAAAPAKKTAKKATSSAGQSVVKKTIGAGAKAVGADVAGGGPENPVADIAALKEASGGGGKTAPAKKAPAKKTAPKKAAPKAPKRVRALKWAWSGNKKLLLGEFLLVIVIVWLGAFTSTGSVKDDIPKAMIKSSALAGIFFLLALVAGSGNKSAKAATALATLITVAYVFTSPETHSVVTRIGSFFAPPKNAPVTEGSQAGSEASTAIHEVYAGATGEGAVGPGGTFTSTTGFSY